MNELKTPMDVVIALSEINAFDSVSVLELEDIAAQMLLNHNPEHLCTCCNATSKKFLQVGVSTQQDET